MLLRIIFFLLPFASQTDSTSSLAPLTYKKVDSATYVQFHSNSYKELIVLGEKALKEDIDFYYLRIRLGISYYNVENYFRAIPHLEAANAINPADEVGQEYLYYAYVFSNRTLEANSFASKMSVEIQKKVKYKQNAIDAISIGVGTSLNNFNPDQSLLDLDKVYASHIYQKRMDFGNILVEQTLLNKLKLQYGFSVFQINNVGIVQTPIPLSTEINTSQTSIGTSNQYQYNIGLSHLLKNNWNISYGFGWYEQNYKTFDGTLYEAKSLGSYSATFSVGKQFRKIYPSMNFSKSNFANAEQYQAEAVVVYYPLGNVNFYTSTSAAYKNDTRENQYIIGQKVGGEVVKNLWLETSAIYGNLLNYVSQNGFITFNSANSMKLILGADLKFIYHNLEFSPSYRFQLIDNSFYAYYVSKSDFALTNLTNYSNHLFLTTVKWNF